MNEIHVRTNKGEYNPGEDIYGVVYLRIVSPTSGRGVRISFYGKEKIEYAYKDVPQDEPNSYMEDRDYICHKNVVLFQSDDPLLIGNWSYPFKIPLPSDIPGSFSVMRATPEVTWEASVDYSLNAAVIGASQGLSVDQSVVVYQSSGCKCPRNSSPVAVHVTQPIRGFIFNRDLHLVARLHEHIHRAGSNLKLRVIITNESSTEVQSLHIKLLRKIRLISNAQPIREDPNVILDERCPSDRLILQVDNSSVVEEQDIDMKKFQKGLDQIQIPLRNKNGHPIYPSVHGKHIKCDYNVFLTFLLTNGSTFDLTVPVPVIISHVNKEWSRWIAPAWLSNDHIQIHHSDSIFGVPENVLSSESFSSLPGFQPL